ncbi:ABC transporter substrate-binding protein [uncultured Desulfovibrio sp.]|uniref:ABC transporter substrate-binding protein n=1 Tax=uncultured Desulfovibrio sp. TaxID=167968 RepID=UPI00320AAA7D
MRTRKLCRVLLCLGLLAGLCCPPGTSRAADAAATVPIRSSITLSTQDGQGKGLPIPVRRVISLYGSFNEILLALGARDVIVARTAADEHLPELAGLPAIGTHMQPNAELIVARKPDVILQMKGRREAGSQTEHLRELGIPVLTFELNSLEDLYTVTLTLGRLVGREVEATNLVGQWRRRLAALRNSYATEPAVRVFFEAGSPNLLAAGKGSIVNDLINAAGGINVVDSPRKLVRLNEEAVLAADPDAYIYQVGPMNPAPQPVAERPHYRELRAVREGRILEVKEELFSRPGPRSIEAAEMLGHWLHARPAAAQGTRRAE